MVDHWYSTGSVSDPYCNVRELRRFQFFTSFKNC
jgi:hypothetical protein